MNFKDFKYYRPNIQEYQKQLSELLEEFNNADNVDKQIELIKTINKARNTISTMATLSSIRHSINTKDEFYDQENDFWDYSGPLVSEIDFNFQKALVNSKFLPQLKKHFPSQWFTLIDLSLKSFDPQVITELQEENKLSSEYAKLSASAEISFEGKIYNLSQMTPFTLVNDREKRKAATLAKDQFFLDNQAKFDEIYDKLVKVRDKIAKKLGYKNFVELGYLRMGRSDYNANDVGNYRKQVLESLVPLTTNLYKKQQKRLAYDKLFYYDEKIEFLSGNPTPKGTAEQLVKAAQKMYQKISPETNEFFNFMLDNNLMDLLAKEAKQGGGYCTYLPDYRSPFIFANFNGTSHDVDVLTHEAGHAFQSYMSRDIEIPDLAWTTMEAAEIHSMSMEFFAHPYMKEFFKEDTEKYYYYHIVDALKFIPYGVCVDHFQHFVYENPNVSPAERKAKWRELEKLYLPHKNYQGNTLLENGGWWYRQAHIFEAPFYYIDYTIAQICALQFYARSLDDYSGTWLDYLELCKVGGTKSFLGLLQQCNLQSPFINGTIKKTVERILPELDKIDDSRF
ncbi:MAG: M3 family oligoendopeptidase [Erysipelotrichaceae bacterium]